MHQQQPKPFLKWAGGKTQLLEHIQEQFPYKKEDSIVYIEPFIGSGAVLFQLITNYPNLKKIIINDINTDLIKVYKSLSTSVTEIIALLKKWEIEYHKLSFNEDKKKEYYYTKRSLFNLRKSKDFIQSALFIFLNRTCFNGLYRVNKNNIFNVPIGNYKKPTICNENNLICVSLALQKVTILNEDFENMLNYAEDKTFFYLDPPYKPLNKTSNFNSYSKNEFNDAEQIRLKKFCDKLNSLNYKWVLSNSDPKNNDPDNDFFDKLYQEYQIYRVPAKRSINSNSQKRGLISELLITNNSKITD